MNDKSNLIRRLLSSHNSRTAYIKAKLSVLVPAQIRALRLKSAHPAMPFQRDLAREAELHQSRISMFETPGVANITLETLAKIAAGLRSGIIVKFVPFSEMLLWENSFSPATFDVKPRLDADIAFLNPEEKSASVEAVAGDLLTDRTPSNEALSATAEPRPSAESMKKPVQVVLIAQGAAVGGR